MFNDIAIRRRFASLHPGPYALFPALALAVSTSRVARASTLFLAPDCSASGDSLKCYMLEFLNFLYAAAGVLALVLIVVVALAVKTYRKNKNNEKLGL